MVSIRHRTHRSTEAQKRHTTHSILSIEETMSMNTIGLNNRESKEMKDACGQPPLSSRAIEGPEAEATSNTQRPSHQHHLPKGQTLHSITLTNTLIASTCKQPPLTRATTPLQQWGERRPTLTTHSTHSQRRGAPGSSRLSEKQRHHILCNTGEGEGPH